MSQTTSTGDRTDPEIVAPEGAKDGAGKQNGQHAQREEPTVDELLFEHVSDRAVPAPAPETAQAKAGAGIDLPLDVAIDVDPGAGAAPAAAPDVAELFGGAEAAPAETETEPRAETEARAEFETEPHVQSDTPVE